MMHSWSQVNIPAESGRGRSKPTEEAELAELAVPSPREDTKPNSSVRAGKTGGRIRRGEAKTLEGLQKSSETLEGLQKKY